MAVEGVCADRRKWVDFMMRFELDLQEPEPQRAARSAATIGGAYVVGGLIPLAPYMVFAETRPALLLSGAVTGAALLGFGWLKAKATGLPALRGAVQTLLIGGVAAAVAELLAQGGGGEEDGDPDRTARGWALGGRSGRRRGSGEHTH